MAFLAKVPRATRPRHRGAAARYVSPSKRRATDHPAVPPRGSSQLSAPNPTTPPAIQRPATAQNNDINHRKSDFTAYDQK
jgi:hypothetical protein